jgi:hypothetical protein
LFPFAIGQSSHPFDGCDMERDRRVVRGSQSHPSAILEP